MPVLRESSTGKFIVYGLQYVNGWIFNWVKWNSATSSNSSSTAFNAMAPGFTPLVFLRVTDDGTNLKFAVSADGQDFTYQLTTESRTALMAGGPNQIGIGADSNNSSPVIITAVHWDVA